MLLKIKRYIASHRWLGILLQVMLFLGIIFLIANWQTRNAARGEAPGFNAYLIQGKPVTLQDYRGKPLLLHFWASWCPVCELEHGSISNLANISEQNNYQVLTIASWSGNEADVVQYMQQEQLDFPVIVDPTGSIAKLYGVQGVPSSFVIDANNTIRFVEQGYTTQLGLQLRLWWLKNN